MQLVKYLPSARIAVLSDLLVRVTQPSELNDPFDLAPTVDRVVPNRRVASVAKTAGRGARGPTRALRFSDFRPYRADQRRELEFMHTAPALNAAFGRMVGDPVRTAILERIGVFSVSDTPTSPTMWSMYAESHRGFALEFDARARIFEETTRPCSPFGVFQPVAYVENRPCISALELLLPITHWSRVLSRRVLFTKSDSCQHEREWRLVLPLDDHERFPHVIRGRLHLFKLAPQAIHRVIIGARSSPEVRKQISAVIRANRELNHVDVIYARLCEKGYGIRLLRR